MFNAYPPLTISNCESKTIEKSQQFVIYYIIFRRCLKNPILKLVKTIIKTTAFLLIIHFIRTSHLLISMKNKKWKIKNKNY